MHYREAKQVGLFDRSLAVHNYAQYCLEHGMEHIYNSPEDILDLCIDMIDAQNGIQPTVESRILQCEFQRRYHDYFGEDSGLGFVGPRFAMKYKNSII